jgi:kumamolisin
VSDARVVLEASRPEPAAGLQKCADPPASRVAHATILVRHRDTAEARSRTDAILNGKAPPLSREEAARVLGADEDDLRKVAAFAEQYGLTVDAASVPERSVKLSGTVPRMEAAFGVKLRCCVRGDATYLYYEEPLSIPSALAGIVEAVLGLDERPAARSA